MFRIGEGVPECNSFGTADLPAGHGAAAATFLIPGAYRVFPIRNVACARAGALRGSGHRGGRESGCFPDSSPPQSWRRPRQSRRRVVSQMLPRRAAAAAWSRSSRTAAVMASSGEEKRPLRTLAWMNCSLRPPSVQAVDT